MYYLQPKAAPVVDDGAMLTPEERRAVRRALAQRPDLFDEVAYK